ncbi:MAG: hypothetical protein IKT32_01820, partial [Clostridia bacterium]|nr:hypothetical protein [Clostridia bacterium]
SSSSSSSSNQSTNSSSSSSYIPPDPNSPVHDLCLSSSNSPEFNSSENATFEIEGLQFQYVNAKTADANSHVELGKAGFITNIDPIGDIRTVTVNYDFINSSDPAEQNLYGFGYLRYRVSNNFVDNPNDFATEIKTTGTNFEIDLTKSSGDFFISFWTPRAIEINNITITFAEDEYIENTDDFTIQLFSTNDIHGQVNASGSYPGLAALTTKMQSLASQNDQFNIFIDQGDIYQGTAESGLTNGYIMDDFLLYNGYDTTTLGNHEFDWGEERIADHVNYSPVTILANNVRYSDTGLSPEWATPYKLVSRNGVKIGIIGSLGNVKSSISASMVTGIDFLTGSSLTAQIKKDSQALKDLGADFIILSIHDGAESSLSNGVSSLTYYDIASLSGSYVDLVLESHTHKRYAFYDSKGVWHLQNGGNGSSFYLSKLKCSYTNGDWEVELSTTSDIPYYYTATASSNDPVINDINEWYDTYI